MVPCGPRPDKPSLPGVLHRYAMSQIAVNSNVSPYLPLRVSDLEVREEEAMPSYDQLCALRRTHPGTQFSYVIGTDWLQPGTDLREWTSNGERPGEKIVTGHKLVS